MFKLNLIKDLKLMSKELKFKMFSGIILLLFVLSGIASVYSYENSMKEFNNSYLSQKKLDEGVLDKADRMLGHNVNYFRIPSKFNLISEKRGFPNGLRSRLVVDDISSSGFDKHTTNYFVLNWLFIIGVICSFSALVFSYNALSKEKKDGTLKLKLVAGLTRHNVLYSKYIANMIFFAITILLGMILSILVSAIMGFSFLSNLTLWGFISLIILVFVISLVYISVFIWTGLFLSLLKNERNGIILALTCWLLIIVIIPNLTWIVGKGFYKVPSNSEMDSQASLAWNEEFNLWCSKYDNPETMENKVGGDGYLAEGYRSGAVQASDEKMSQVQTEIGKQHLAQIEFLEKLSCISPYSQLDKLFQLLVEQGLTTLKVEMKSLVQHRNKIEETLKSLDAGDEESLHLWYSWAGDDGSYGLNPFTTKPYTDKDNFILTKHLEIPNRDKLKQTTPIVIIMLLMNCLIVIITLFKLKRYDVR